jgi:hypothetical protein
MRCARFPEGVGLRGAKMAPSDDRQHWVVGAAPELLEDRQQRGGIGLNNADGVCLAASPPTSTLCE